MKTAISLPDQLFSLAEIAARKLRMSRSELYATALTEFLERRQTSKITERLNAIYSEVPAKLDPGFGAAQTQSLNLDNDGW
jgi:metal-responsive CopG/Arc/MetJ family transcriptional regulator